MMIAKIRHTHINNLGSMALLPELSFLFINCEALVSFQNSYDTFVTSEPPKNSQFISLTIFFTDSVKHIFFEANRMLRPGNAGARAGADLTSVALFFDKAKRIFFLIVKKKLWITKYFGGWDATNELYVYNLTFK